MNTTVTSNDPADPWRWKAAEPTVPSAQAGAADSSPLAAGAALAVRAVERSAEVAAKRATVSAVSQAARAWGSAAVLEGGAGVGEGSVATGASGLGALAGFALTGVAAIAYQFFFPAKAGDRSEYAGTAPYPSPQQNTEDPPQTATRWPTNPNDDPQDPNHRFGWPAQPTQIKTSRSPDPDAAVASANTDTTTDTKVPGDEKKKDADKRKPEARDGNRRTTVVMERVVSVPGSASEKLGLTAPRPEKDTIRISEPPPRSEPKPHDPALADTQPIAVPQEKPAGTAESDWAESIVKGHGIDTSDIRERMVGYAQFEIGNLPPWGFSQRARAALADIRIEAKRRGITDDRQWPSWARTMRDALMLDGELPFAGAYAGANNISGTPEQRRQYLYNHVRATYGIGKPEKVDEWLGRPLSVPNDQIERYELTSDGFFLKFEIKAEVEEGDKIHASATVANSREVARKVLPVLREMKVPHKAVVNEEAYREWEDDPDTTQRGKFITIYPQSEAQAKEVARRLTPLLRGMQGPAVKGEQPIGDSNMLWAQYTNYRNDRFRHPLRPNEVVQRVRGREASPSLVERHHRVFATVGEGPREAREPKVGEQSYTNQPGLTEEEKAFGRELYAREEAQKATRNPKQARIGMFMPLLDDKNKFVVDGDGYIVMNVKLAFRYHQEDLAKEAAAAAAKTAEPPIDVDKFVGVYISTHYHGLLLGWDGMPRKNGFLDINEVKRRILEAPGGAEKLRQAIEQLPERVRKNPGRYER